MSSRAAHDNRVLNLHGSPFEIGYAAGQSLGQRLEANIEHYVLVRGPTAGAFGEERWRRGATYWLHSLPERFLREFEGLAAGAKLPLQRVAEWAYLETTLAAGCTGAIVTLDDRVWVTRNNDFYVPNLWGYVSVKEVTGRIPAITFGMEGDVFTPTGINHELLWLHYNWLPAWDVPTTGKPHLPCYAWLVEALETCRTLPEIEALLGRIQRDGGMLLFAVDGKTDAFALFECTCTEFRRRDAAAGRLVGANHYCVHPQAPPSGDDGPLSSVGRQCRMASLVAGLAARDARPDPARELMAILADGEIEARSGDPVTVYSNVACSGTQEIWYTFGGAPAASCGNWQRLSWPW